MRDSFALEEPADAIARDEALLSAVAPNQSPMLRWWVPSSPAVVVGLGLRHRLAQVVDLERCAKRDVAVLERSAGGGALLLDQTMLCGAICLPLPATSGMDVTESYRWLGEVLAAQLRSAGVGGARRVEVEEARRDVAALREPHDRLGQLLLATCFGALSPHEVVTGDGRKVVGLAQVRRRHAALFQVGILLRDQSPLADYLVVPDEPTRERVRDALRARTAGLRLTDPAISAMASAVADATPCAR